MGEEQADALADLSRPISDLFAPMHLGGEPGHRQAIDPITGTSRVYLRVERHGIGTKPLQIADEREFSASYDSRQSVSGGWRQLQAGVTPWSGPLPRAGRPGRP